MKKKASVNIHKVKIVICLGQEEQHREALVMKQ